MAGTPKKSSPSKTTPSKKDAKKDTPSKKDAKKDTPSKKDTSPKSKDQKKSPVKDSPSSKTSPKKEDLAAKAMELYAQGKRHLLVNDVNSAVNSLQEACRMLAAQHGETAPELGDAYFYYGRALLELARIENGVLGNALEGVPEGEDEDLDSSQFENPDKLPTEEKEKVAEQVGEALEENFKNLEKKSSPSKDSKKDGDAKDKTVNVDADEPMEDGDKKDASSSKDKDAKKSPAKDEKATKDKSGAKDKDSAMDTDSKDDKETKDESQDEDESQEEGEDDESQEDEEEDTEEGDEGKGEGEKAEEDEDVSNLQLAWEILELAKVIYQKQEEGDKEMSLKTGQVFLKLGEVGLESENYPQCIEDFQSCLKIQEKHMKADDRCLAETHYQLGVAHSFNDDFDKSIESFTKASKIIEDRTSNLEKRKKEKEGWTEEQKKKDAGSLEDPSYTEEAEIKELNNLLPEIKEKITDMEEMKKDSKDKINKVKKELGMASAIGGTKETESTSNGFGSSSTSGDAKPVDTSMIRKKRKPEDEAEGDASKKTKAENGAKNGHTSPEKMDTGKDSKTSELKKKAAVDMEKKTKEIKEQAA